MVVDVLLREHRDCASAEAFLRQAAERTGVVPHEVVTESGSDAGHAARTTGSPDINAQSPDGSMGHGQSQAVDADLVID